VTDLWCVSGVYVGYVEDGLLFLGDSGACVGRAIGDRVFGRRGTYVGQILGDRIGFSESLAGLTGDTPPDKTVVCRRLASRAATSSPLHPFKHDR